MIETETTTVSWGNGTRKVIVEEFMTPTLGIPDSFSFEFLPNTYLISKCKTSSVQSDHLYNLEANIIIMIYLQSYIFSFKSKCSTVFAFNLIWLIYCAVYKSI